MGEAKRRREAGHTSDDPRPRFMLNTVLLTKPNDYQPPQGKVVVIVDESASSLPVIAFELDAPAVPLIVKDCDDYARNRTPRELEGMFFGALHDWRHGKLQPDGSNPFGRNNQIGALALSGVFWLAYGERVQEPNGSQIRCVARDMQLEHYGTSCITMAILLRPMNTAIGRAPRTRRWLLEPTGPPGYMNAHDFPGAATAH